MVGKVGYRGETGSTGGMTTPLTWIAGLSKSIAIVNYFNNNTHGCGTVRLHRSATVNTVASTMYTMNSTP